MDLSRRQWFKAASGLLLAPAIVHTENIMQVKEFYEPAITIIPHNALDQPLADIINTMLSNKRMRNRLIEEVIQSNPLMDWVYRNAV